MTKRSLKKNTIKPKKRTITHLIQTRGKLKQRRRVKPGSGPKGTRDSLELDVYEANPGEIGHKALEWKEEIQKYNQLKRKNYLFNEFVVRDTDPIQRVKDNEKEESEWEDDSDSEEEGYFSCTSD